MREHRILDGIERRGCRVTRERTQQSACRDEDAEQDGVQQTTRERIAPFAHVHVRFILQKHTAHPQLGKIQNAFGNRARRRQYVESLEHKSSFRVLFYPISSPMLRAKSPRATHRDSLRAAKTNAVG